MPALAVKTVRFTQIVGKCGRPRVHTLWVAPEKDLEFSRARKADRVMTIAPAGRGKTDTGLAGYHPEQGNAGQFLLFPKSLKRFEGARVIGIKFELVEQPKVVTATAETARPARRGRPIPSPPTGGSSGPRKRRRRNRVREAR